VRLSHLLFEACAQVEKIAINSFNWATLRKRARVIQPTPRLAHRMKINYCNATIFFSNCLPTIYLWHMQSGCPIEQNVFTICAHHHPNMQQEQSVWPTGAMGCARVNPSHPITSCSYKHAHAITQANYRPSPIILPYPPSPKTRARFGTINHFTRSHFSLFVELTSDLVCFGRHRVCAYNNNYYPVVFIIGTVYVRPTGSVSGWPWTWVNKSTCSCHTVHPVRTY
jgi:hypothetical protein